MVPLSVQRRVTCGRLSLDLLVHVVVELVVAAQRDHGAEAQTVGEEDLRGSVDPHLDKTKHNHIYTSNTYRLYTGLFNNKH